jgi:peptide chain release factor 2
MTSSDFWNDKDNADKVISEISSLREISTGVVECNKRLTGDIEVFDMLESDYDDELKASIENEVIDIEKIVSELEILLLLSGPHDKNNCILEVHSGAGGTEACDWAMMLYRMYIRWFERRGYKYEVIDIQDGEEAGIKSASILVKGIYAYGYLKNEKGIHRLVRLSPFDSNNKRHTSFASIDVTPEFDNTVDITILDSDLKIDVYRSSGAGGQSVNTTDSAVRITHLPTKIVVTCQNERSQIQNREKAMQMLKNKLKFLEIEKQNEELAKVKGSHMEINFGSQIRSYVMHPYSMVKDLRTSVETSNVVKVLDGDIDMFIEANLKEVKNEN